MEIIKAHQNKSEEVKKENLLRVIKDATEMIKLCFKPIGLYNGGFAIAHQQVEDNYPLRFFVLKTGEIIVNPKIIRHTVVPVDSLEGCLSFPKQRQILVPRWNKCEVEYKTVKKDGTLSDTIRENLSGPKSKIFQHEIDHLNCKYIYK